MNEIKRLVELSEKGQAAMRAAEGTEDTSFERAAAFADETHFRAELAAWFRANLQSLESVRSEAPWDAIRMLLHKFERAGGPWKVANFGVELGASSWASNVENALNELDAAIKEKDVHSTELRK